MIALAVLLLIAVAAVVVFVLVTGTTATAPLVWESLNLSWTPSVLVVFLLGVLTLFVAEVALALIRGGTRRTIERRRELKRLRQVEQEKAAERERERESAAAPDTAVADTTAYDTTAHDTTAHDTTAHDTTAYDTAETRPIAPPAEDGRHLATAPGAPTTATRTDGDDAWYDNPPDRR
jgi:hypothetical protein